MISSDQPVEICAASENFYSGAIDRIKWTIMVLSVVLSPVAWLLYGIRPAAGFCLGSALSYWNFHLLARAVHGLAGRIVDRGSKEKGGAVVARFFLRYLVIGGVVYVTFVSSFGAFEGLLIGLCMPVVGMMAEAAYEAYGALRRGF